jgi:hypothetical protein
MALIDLFQFFVAYDRTVYEVHFPADAAVTEEEVAAFGRGLCLPEEFRVYLTTPLAGFTVTARASGRRLHVLSLAEVRARRTGSPWRVLFVERDGLTYCFDGQGRISGHPGVDFADLVLAEIREL